ncbi:hypothetical protein [Streptosporangium sp. NPDC049046]|uniref:hypothetical protein n=1 Tax=Streptosporangium sp. NPDC049046 TaxID=3155031 RepID=UPI003429EB19
MAIALHQSPSSISQQLSILEREARTPLLGEAQGAFLSMEGVRRYRGRALRP